MLFELAESDRNLIGDLMGKKGELVVRNIVTKEYVGFDIYDETVDQPE